MSDTIEKQIYELAYHLNSSLEEADVQKTRQDLEKIVTSHGGIVLFSKDPERFRLSYPIKHQMNTYFGYFNFNLESIEDVPNQIRDELKMNHNILRSLILKVEPKNEKEDLAHKLAIAEKRRIRALKQAEKAVGPKTEAPKMDEKAVDEKLEEIIEKL